MERVEVRALLARWEAFLANVVTVVEHDGDTLRLEDVAACVEGAWVGDPAKSPGVRAALVRAGASDAALAIAETRYARVLALLRARAMPVAPPSSGRPVISTPVSR